MKKIAFFLMVFAVHGICQTPPKDSDTLQALLVEVRQLRQDIEAMTVASQRVQIALYGLQMQDAAVARAAKRADDARNKVTAAESNRDHIAADYQRLESAINSGSMTDADSKIAQQRLPQMKSELDRATAELQSQQAAESDASSQLRNEQAKLGELQERIDKLDQALGKMAGAGK